MEPAGEKGKSKETIFELDLSIALPKCLIFLKELGILGEMFKAGEIQLFFSPQFVFCVNKKNMKHKCYTGSY